MYEIEVVIFTGAVAAIVGLLLGAGLHRSVGSSSAKVKRLKRDLERAEESNRNYQRDVAEHFGETANLLNGLTRQYKSIHDHLAGGADKLCRDASGQSLLAGAPLGLSIEERRKDIEGRRMHEEASIKPPLDYAPKTDTRSGTLSEEYGLEKVKLRQQEAELSADSVADAADTVEAPAQGPALKMSSANA